ncbi:MAG: class I mannose-6-phosphate isomerase [Clostridia bacterium]|nr:class I mannose-6-phosphate isomerase [Clostridia bacterium]
MYPMLLLCHSAQGEAASKTFRIRRECTEKEIYLLSGRDSGESVVKNGEFKGDGINEVLSRLSDSLPARALPIYIKFINTGSRLPVKVYPDSEYAARHGSGTGKASLIYIIEASEGAEMIYGFSRAVSSEELRRRMLGGSLSAVCNFVSAQKGDVFFVPPGVVFAVGGGISAIEISINSDSEYIISDYNRSGDGSRPFELNRALEVVNPQKINIAYGNTGDLTLFPFGTVREIGKTDEFSVCVMNVDGNVGIYEEKEYSSIIAVSGEADASYPTGTMHIKEGDSVLLPPGVKIRLSGRAEILYTKFK